MVWGLLLGTQYDTLPLACRLAAMAGRPELQSLAKRIELAGGEDYMFGRIEDGDTPRVIMEDFGVSRTYFYRWINLDKDRRQKLLREARAVAAMGHAEDAGEVLDELVGTVITPADVTLANSRSNYKRWLAEVYERGAIERTETKDSLVLNIGQLHLSALKEAGRAHVAELQSGPVVEAEVVE